ncbi:MAG: hypothetical protein IJC68_03690, partial [Firmicutes bacterium]|nr:hypothetical protein [Bacillota bacterium]
PLRFLLRFLSLYQGIVIFHAHCRNLPFVQSVRTAIVFPHLLFFIRNSQSSGGSIRREILRQRLYVHCFFKGKRV